MVAPIHHEEEPNLGEDFLMWPHPMNSSEALFVVDDAAKRATREVASRSHEGVQATLAKMGDAVTAVAWHQMTDNVMAKV